MSTYGQHHCTQKAVIGLVAAFLFACLISTGCAFLLTPLRASTTSPWVGVADADTLPKDGTPVRVSVAVVERDAWTRRECPLGHVFLRKVLETGEIVAVDAVTRYGVTIEYDTEARKYQDRRCWGFHFDLDGKCTDPNPHSDLLKLDVQVRDGKVYINREFLR